MKSFLQLNLQAPDRKPETATLGKPDGDQAQSPISGKKLNRLANRAAHKAATVYGRGGSGIFSK
ncbi:MAG TPA: hypothetical protein VG893_06915 [Terracidiphilus sp.]|nr:hypothetical protein [Terracidiphilus sp.]